MHGFITRTNCDYPMGVLADDARFAGDDMHPL